MNPPYNPASAKRQAWIVLSICGMLALAILSLVAVWAQRHLSEVAAWQPSALDDLARQGMCDQPAEWITADDYPPDAIRRNEEGTVRIVWTVGGDGRVAACRVAESSGHPSLDRAACRAIKARGCYGPTQAAGRTMSRRVVWRLPHE